MRRIHVSQVRAGQNILDAAEAHHALRVLRLEDGAEVELFDDAGDVASGKLTHRGGKTAEVHVERISPRQNAFHLAVASAVPKGDRADWMIEKLSELGVTEFIPLAADRSVVLPEGVGKRQRWMRIAVEAAKQSHRQGVMQIQELTAVGDLIARSQGGSSIWCLSMACDAIPIIDAAAHLPSDMQSLTLLIGPEGGWTDVEIARFRDARLTGVALTKTILRIETAAVASAAVIVALITHRKAPNRGST